MKVFFSVGKDNRIQGWGSSSISDNDVELDLDEFHEALKNPYIFRYENGELIKDVEWQQEQIDKRSAILDAPSNESQIATLSYQLMEQSYLMDMTEREKAEMTYQLMESEARVNEVTEMNASLVYSLMEKGVL